MTVSFSVFVPDALDQGVVVVDGLDTVQDTVPVPDDGLHAVRESSSPHPVRGVVLA